MDLSELKKLVQLMVRAELSELELDDSKRGLRVHLKRDLGKSQAEGGANMLQVLPGVMSGVMPGAVQAASPQAAAPAPAAPAAQEPGEAPPGSEVFKSPIVGTFYRSSAPEAEPFVSPGKTFAADAVLCIIEAMKVMNEIRAEFPGEVLEVLAENGEPVEFGQPLFLIKKA